jgi:hypothetical protein
MALLALRLRGMHDAFQLFLNLEKEKVMRELAFKSGQVARLYKVAPRTVTGWTDDGTLECWRIPGRGNKPGDRRIPRSALVKAFGPNTTLGVDLRRSEVAFLGREAAPAFDILKNLLGPDYELEARCDSFELGLKSHFATLHAVVLDGAYVNNELDPQGLQPILDGLRGHYSHSADFHQVVVALLIDGAESLETLRSSSRTLEKCLLNSSGGIFRTKWFQIFWPQEMNALTEYIGDQQ